MQLTGTGQLTSLRKVRWENGQTSIVWLYLLFILGLYLRSMLRLLLDRKSRLDLHLGFRRLGLGMRVRFCDLIFPLLGLGHDGEDPATES